MEKSTEQKAGIVIPDNVELTEPLRIYIEEISQIPPLSEVEEAGLAKQMAAGEEEAIRRMEEASLGLVVSIAGYYSDREMPFLDLIQEGNIGLMRAMEQYEYEEGRRFADFASLYIESAIQTAIDEETAEIERILALMKKSVPEGTAVEEESKTEEDNTDAAETAIAALIQKEEVEALLKSLNEQERQVIGMRFGLYDKKVRTPEEISEVLEITEAEAVALEDAAMQKLKEAALKQQA